jgi:membrane-associated protease RseP (regulator of RpoE activity)
LPTRQCYWDETGKRCSFKNQFSRIDRKYNLRGDIIEESVFDSDDQPMVGPGGFHKSVQQFDGSERIEIQMFGVDGKPTADKSGIVHQRYHYNDRRQVVKTENLGADGKPALGSDGIAAWTIKYDSEGRVVEHRFLGADGNPCLNVIWSAGERYRYDADGKPNGTANFDQSGRDLELRVAVIEVKPGRAAERAGFRIGDIVEKYAGKTIVVPNDITEVVQAMNGDAIYEVDIRRDGKPMTLKLPSGSPGANFGKRYVLK